MTLAKLVDYTRAHDARFVLVRPDTQLIATLKAYGTLDKLGEDDIFATLEEAFATYRASSTPEPPGRQPPSGRR